MDKVIVWEKTRKILAGDISETLFKIWFTKVEVSSIVKNGLGYQIVLGCPNKFLAEQIEKRCGGVLIAAFAKVLGGEVGLGLTVVKNDNGMVDGKDHLGEEAGLGLNGGSHQNLAYTFEDFVVGESNRLAHSAARAVCTQPGSFYNPLFIYGGTGLGKTHLLGAITNQLGKLTPALAVSYKTTEAFTNEFIEALATNSIRVFREKHRRVDVLLIDDVQFLSGKPGTQDEFFHTFNELYSLHHQIVLTSDRHPSEIGRLEERLVSRFLGGLTCDIAPPELELKMAIFAKKAQGSGLGLDNQTFQFLAETVTNPREIGGVIATIAQSVKLGGERDLAAIKALFGKKQSQVRAAPKLVISVVARFYGVKAGDILGSSRRREFTKARQVVMFILRNDLGLSYSFIGQLLGARDHSTVIHGVEAIRKEVGEVAGLRENLLEIKRGLAL